MENEQVELLQWEAKPSEVMGPEGPGVAQRPQERTAE